MVGRDLSIIAHDDVLPHLLAENFAPPLTVTSPMCEMSKMPAAFRTAACSSMMDVYCTGISQPPNSMSFPPCF